MGRPVAALLSFRLGGPDGVSVEAAKWRWALEQLGFDVLAVGGAGVVDRRIDGLTFDLTNDEQPSVSASDVAAALAGVDLTVVANVCSIPLNPSATAAVANALRGRPAVMWHHDLGWQRPAFADAPAPPDDPAWRHVTINDLSRRELADRGIVAVTMYNAFDTEPSPGDRHRTRSAIAATTAPVVLQPTRAIPRKRVAAGLALAEAVGGSYWLLGPAEDGFAGELDRVLAGASVPVLRGLPAAVSIADAYAACDLVALPSSWEGFGNPALEAAVYRRPLAIGRYPVADELAAFGFRWLDADDVEAVAAFVHDPDPDVVETNRRVAEKHFALHDLPGRLAAILPISSLR